MAYIEIKTINGRRYKYLRKSIRLGERMKKVSLRCLGPVEPIYRVKKKRKTNASIYVEEITSDEKNSLKKALQSSNSFVRDRAKIILLSSEKLSPVAVALKLGCGARKVRTAIKAFKDGRLNALIRKKSPGTRQKISETDKKIILIHFSKSPREFGFPISAWTIPKFAEHLRKSGVADITDEWTRKILLKA